MFGCEVSGISPVLSGLRRSHMYGWLGTVWQDFGRMGLSLPVISGGRGPVLTHSTAWRFPFQNTRALVQHGVLVNRSLILA